MKKIIYTLAVLSLLASSLPAMADETASTTVTTTVATENTVTTSTTTTTPAKKYVRRVAEISGKLTSVSSSTLVVTLTKVSPRKAKKWTGAYPEVNKELVVNISSTTKFVRRFMGRSNLDELTVGDSLQINGKTNEDGSFNANLVKDNSLHATLRVRSGVVDSINAEDKTFVLKEKKNTFTVTTGDKTRFIVPAVSSSTFSDLKAGDKVHVRGILNTQTIKLDASLVRVNRPLATDISTSTNQ